MSPQFNETKADFFAGTVFKYFGARTENILRYKIARVGEKTCRLPSFYKYFMVCVQAQNDKGGIISHIIMK